MASTVEKDELPPCPPAISGSTGTSAGSKGDQACSTATANGKGADSAKSPNTGAGSAAPTSTTGTVNDNNSAAGNTNSSKNKNKKKKKKKKASAGAENDAAADAASAAARTMGSGTAASGSGGIQAPTAVDGKDAPDEAAEIDLTTAGAARASSSPVAGHGEAGAVAGSAVSNGAEILRLLKRQQLEKMIASAKAGGRSGADQGHK